MSWQTAKLSAVATIERDGIVSDAIPSGTSYLGLEHIEAGGKILGAATVEAGDLASTKFRFTKRHVLYGKLRPYLAKISTPDFDGICSTDIVPIMPGPKLDRSFLTHYLRQPAMVDFANSRSTGANLPRLSPKALAEFEIPLPPLDEQKRIAAILDQADELRRKRQRAIDRLNQLGQAIFHDMFGDFFQSKDDMVELGAVCDVRDGTHDSPKYVEDGHPLLTSKNFSGGRIDYEGAKLISDEDFIKVNKRSEVNKGDIVMPMIGTIGSPVIVDFDPDFAIKNVALIKFQDSDMNAEFVRQVLDSSLFEAHVANKGRGGTQKFVSLGDIRKFMIPTPSSEHQRDFANRVRSLKVEQEKLLSSMDLMQDLFASLQHRAFQGEL
jgi:type I restriction enzyme S subunit